MIGTLVFLPSLLLIIPSLITIPTTKAFDYFTNCTGSPTYTQNSSYQTNLRNLLPTLPTQALNSGFYSTSLGRPPNRVYALYLCRPDVDSRGCSKCVHQAQTSILQECPTEVWAVLWYDDCMLRFNNTPVYRTMQVSLSIVVWNPNNLTRSLAQIFPKVLNDTIAGLVTRVGNDSGRFGTEEANLTGSELYALAQCTPDLSQGQCDKCLRVAMGQVPNTYPGGWVLLPSCNVRFELDSKFYGEYFNYTFLLSATNSTTTPTSPPTGPKEQQKGSAHIAVVVALPLILAVLLLCSVCFCYRYRKSREPSPEELEEITTAESLQFDFRIVRAATDNFSLSNKLGEGGFGGVYKGRLPNGQEIAVKRLSTNSGQGSREFKTEVLLVARLQHKNLVRLLGFCLRKDEKLLIYELLPKSSLDKVLLDRSKDVSVDWETRYKIIAGIARGLLYLHEDSRLKIIHRDLKSSNILLDESMNPKISDFGLAKLVGTGQIQADTNRIVGTYGYMAPEYAMTGRFSIKSDVYSFGIIVLEIVSGHKCNSTAFPYHEESLIQRAWRLWNDVKALEMVDPRLGGNFSSNEVSKCIHIGLLCIQEDANRRPTMVPIVSTLNGHPVDLPAPSPPQLAGTGHVSPQTSSTFSGNKDSITELYPR